MAAPAAASAVRPSLRTPWLRRGTAALFDASAWAAALTAACWLRFDFDPAQIQLTGLLWTISVAVAVLWSAGFATFLYFGRCTTGSLDEALTVAGVAAVVGITLSGVVLLSATPQVPRSVPVAAAPLALALMLAPRLIVRGHRARQARPDRDRARRVIVYGAGRRGQQLVRAMLTESAGGLLPVAILDDDPALRHNRISGIPVRGDGQAVPAVAAETKARLVVVAFDTAAPETMRRLLSTARTAGLEVKTVPPLHELLRPCAGIADLRELDVADLLGRQQIDTDLDSIADCLTGKRVLVTGAGGSIGSELCRQIHRFGPAELVMLDHDESALHAVQLSLHAEARLDSPEVVLADIRDTQVMRTVLADRRPDIVFHAAALKHLAALERHPGEAWKTNVLGTLGVLGAAIDAGVGKFVNISTDKAANPTSVLGRSKRIGERLVADAAGRTGRTYLSVRFGNVLGSRGSVLTTFAEQLAAGRPVTVTHPDVTRFFMTVPEAVQLVVQAAAIGSSGEVLILDMGEPARIRELAEMLMTLSGRRSKIVYTGLREGEKLHEELFGDGESDWRPLHPLISQIAAPPLDPDIVRLRESQLGPERAMSVLVAERPDIPRQPDPRRSPPRPPARVAAGDGSAQ